MFWNLGNKETGLPKILHSAILKKNHLRYWRRLSSIFDIRYISSPVFSIFRYHLMAVKNVSKCSCLIIYNRPRSIICSICCIAGILWSYNTISGNKLSACVDLCCNAVYIVTWLRDIKTVTQTTFKEVERTFRRQWVLTGKSSGGAWRAVLGG